MPSPQSSDNDAIIADYLASQAMHWSPRTIEQRRWQLRIIADQMPVTLTEVTETHVLHWHAGLRGRPETIASYVSAARGLYRWMSVRSRPRIRVDDPTVLLERPRIPEAAPRPMSDRHVDLAFACATADPEIWCWLGLMACCGLRCCEVAALQTHDIQISDTSGALMHVTGKGRKQRVVPLPEVLLVALRPFLAGAGSVFTRPSDGRPYRPKGISEHTNRFLRSVRIHETAHQLRHKFATDYHAIDVDLYRQAKLMGHGSVDTTKRYTAIDPTESARYVAMLAERRCRARRPAADRSWRTAG